MLVLMIFVRSFKAMGSSSPGAGPSAPVPVERCGHVAAHAFIEDAGVANGGAEGDSRRGLEGPSHSETPSEGVVLVETAGQAGGVGPPPAGRARGRPGRSGGGPHPSAPGGAP